ncbi:MAG: hypothetical protein ACFB20_11210 [Opitutales bacterium]
MSATKWIGIALCWLGTWLGLAAALVLWGGLMGAIVGLLSYPAFQLFSQGYEVVFLVQRGSLLGAQYAGVWALGISLVLCFVIGHRRLERGDRPSSPSKVGAAPQLQR